jgi:hypothetical protein
LLGDEANECAENAFALPDWEREPQRVGTGIESQPRVARGGTTTVRDRDMTILLVDRCAGALDTNPSSEEALAAQ